MQIYHFFFLVSPILSILTDFVTIYYFKENIQLRFRTFFILFTVADVILNSSGLILFSRSNDDIDSSGYLCTLQNSLLIIGIVYRSFGAFVIAYGVHIVFKYSIFSDNLSYSNPSFKYTLVLISVLTILCLSFNCVQVNCTNSYMPDRQIPNFSLKVTLLLFISIAVPATMFCLSAMYAMLTSKNIKVFYKTQVSGLSNVIVVFLKLYSKLFFVLSISIAPLLVAYSLRFNGICRCDFSFLFCHFLVYTTGTQVNLFFYYATGGMESKDNDNIQSPINRGSNLQLSIHTTDFPEEVLNLS